jgi:hypothetical protein
MRGVFLWGELCDVFRTINWKEVEEELSGLQLNQRFCSYGINEIK